MKKTLLFNPIGVVHNRHIGIFEKAMPGWTMRRIYNPRHPWFAAMDKTPEAHYFVNGRVPARALDDVAAVVCFSAQPRVPSFSLIQEAALRGLPVIAIEEVYQMMLEQGYVNEYFLPVDHLFAGSGYEREKFLASGVDADVVETTGCPFRYVSGPNRDEAGARHLKEGLGCDPSKPIALLSLAYLTPTGETTEIRRKLLTMVNDGLPKEYELVVKPHPAESDKNALTFIKKYAPRARIADMHMPIDRLLECVDLLFNRGNSQVIVNALDKCVPVAVIPAGRETIFNGLLDEIIINEAGDIARVIDIIRSRGMEIYRPIYERYLSIGITEAMAMVVSRIEQIASSGILHNPGGRLLEIALFWAWIGHTSESLKLFRVLEKRPDVDAAIARRACRLVLCRADAEDMVFLKRWAVIGYRKWVVQSLWVRSLYTANRRMDVSDKEWLADFPPRMNRLHFLPFIFMLGWCYARSGMRDDANELAEGIHQEYRFIKGVPSWTETMRSRSGVRKTAEYWRMRIDYHLRTAAKELRLRQNI